MNLQEQFAQATKEHQQGDLIPAQQHYLAILKESPRHIETHYNLANLYAQLTQWHSAITHYRLALKYCPDQPLIQYNLSIALLNADGFGEAIHLLRQVVTALPEHYDARHLLACTLMGAGEYAEAKTHFLAAITQKSDDAQTYFNLGVLSLYEQDLPAAQQYFTKAIYYQEDFTDAYYNLGVIAEYQAETEVAIKYFKQALHYDEQYFAAHYQLVLQYKNSDDTENAILHCEKALLLQPNNASLRYLRAVLTKETAITSAPDDYIQNLFDSYALYYDKHVAGLAYNVPRYLREMVDEVIAPSKNPTERIIDLGCGTGLSGYYFRDRAIRLVGVDLSARMLAVARKKEIYDALQEANLLAFLQQQTELVDMIIAADTLVYSGDLQAIFKECARLLNKEGLFVFSVEEGEKDYQLLSSGRFAHDDHYIKALLAKNDLKIHNQRSAVIRLQQKAKINGLLYIVSRK